MLYSVISFLGSQLRYPVATRWNSLFDSVQDLLDNRSNLKRLCEQLSVAEIVESDVFYLEKYLQLMRPLAEATDFRKGEENNNIQTVLQNSRFKFATANS